jgi:hypothetical protein
MPRCDGNGRVYSVMMGWFQPSTCCVVVVLVAVANLGVVCGKRKRGEASSSLSIFRCIGLDVLFLRSVERGWMTLISLV